VIHDDKELQKLIAGLKVIDDQVTTEAISAYAIFLAAVPAKRLRLLAVRGAMLASGMAFELDRHNPALESFLQYLMLEVAPAAKL
jgi:hypothetical protein